MSDINARARDRYRKDPAKVSQRNKRWRDRQPKEKLKAMRRASRLRLYYRMTEEDIDRMLNKQKGKCSICETILTKVSLHIDHDHKTGRVRGLLCRLCNFALGAFHDNPRSARRAAEYLEKFDSLLLPKTVHKICLENYD